MKKEGKVVAGNSRFREGRVLQCEFGMVGQWLRHCEAKSVNCGCAFSWLGHVVLSRTRTRLGLFLREERSREKHA